MKTSLSQLGSFLLGCFVTQSVSVSAFVAGPQVVALSSTRAHATAGAGGAGGGRSRGVGGWRGGPAHRPVCWSGSALRDMDVRRTDLGLDALEAGNPNGGQQKKQPGKLQPPEGVNPQRAFEYLVDYPCKFSIRVVGHNLDNFAQDIVEIVGETCECDPLTIEYKTRETDSGKYTSVTVMAPVQSAEMLYATYAAIDNDTRVRFKF